MLGAEAPYFYRGRRGRYAGLLERLALYELAPKHLGTVGRLPTHPVRSRPRGPRPDAEVARDGYAGSSGVG